AGHDVTLFDLWTEHMAAVREQGLRVEGVSGDFRVHPIAVDRPGDVAESDIALIYVTANDTKDAAKTAARVLGPAGYALTLQNGIGNVESLSEELGPGRVVAGVTHHSAAMAGPGHVRHTHSGPNWIGELDGTTTPRLSELVDLLTGAGHEVVVVDDVIAQIWNKFVLNCGINAISAVTGLRLGEIARTPSVDRFQDLVIDEILAVVEAKGIRLPDPHPRKSIKDHTRSKYNQPSMLQHVEYGKRTEIDALNGALVEEARKLGLSAPYNEALTLLTKGVERHRIRVVHEPPLDYDELEAEAKAETAAGG
ncbi:MAG: ketopantoate reductase family protein, partial [Alphaproteobacteria bacterium]